MAIKDLFRGRSDEVIGTRVLVAGLDPKFADLVENDRACYAKVYPKVTTMIGTIQELMDTISKGYDVMHLFCEVSQDGSVKDSSGAATNGTALIDGCCEADVKLLWVGNENKPEGYIKGFNAAGKRLNMVMTINRHGPKFSAFLDKLLSRMSEGETMPIAWVALVSQNPADPRHQESPACIFAAGRGGVKLR